MPVVLGPAIITLIYLDRKAHKMGIVNMASSNAARREARALAAEKREKGEEADHPHGLIVAEAAPSNLTWSQRVKANLAEIDGFGLILLGFGWSLLLLPFSLRSYAKNGWKNPSLIAMMVVGGVILILFVLFERFVAKNPIVPRRLLLNKTFMCAAGIDFLYFSTSLSLPPLSITYPSIPPQWLASSEVSTSHPSSSSWRIGPSAIGRTSTTL